MKTAKTICGTIFLEGNSIIEKSGDMISTFLFPSNEQATAYFNKRRIRQTGGAKTSRPRHVEYSYLKPKKR